MNIKDLKYIALLAQHRHFGEAAKAAFVSQPTLSMQIKKLEEELGCAIFERTHKEALLTPAGEEIVRQANKILDSVDVLKAVAESFKDPFGGVLRLGAFPTLAPYYFPSIIPKIKNAFPKLKILLVEHKTQALLTALQEGHLDLAFISLPIENNLQAQFRTEYIFEEAFYLAVPKGHVLAKKSKVSVDDVASQELLLLEEGHCMRGQILQVCDAMGAHEQMDFRATSLETLRQMIIMNGSVTLIPGLAVNREDKQIVYVPFVAPAPSRRIALVCRESFTRMGLVDALVEVLKR